MKKRWVWIVVGVVVVLVAAAAGIVLWGMSGSTVTGAVVDARDGKALPNATISVDGSSVPVSNGHLDAKLSLGSHTVEVSAPGYETVARTVDLKIFRSSSLGDVALRNADLTLTIVENYPGAKPVRGARIAIGDVAGKANKKGIAVFTGLPIGEATGAVTCRDYEKGKLTLQLQPGANEVSCKLTPDVLVVTNRAMVAALANDHVLLWQLIHPVRQREYGSRSAYLRQQSKNDKELLNQGIVVQRFKVLTPVHMKSYRYKPAGKTFKDVWRVPVTAWATAPVLAVFGMGSIPVSQSMYWVRGDNGQWLSLGDGTKPK